MKVILTIFLLLGVSCAKEGEGCSEEDVAVCFVPLLAFADPDLSKEDGCESLGAMYECIREKADQCLASEDIEDVESDLEPMREVLESLCMTSDDEEDDEDDTEVENLIECLSDNEAYILDCKNEVSALISDPGFKNEKGLKCHIIENLSECASDRAEEKCGLEAGLAMALGFEAEFDTDEC